MSDLSFAKVAISRGFITPDQLREALGIQKRVEEAGIQEDLGAILLKKGWLRPEQLAEIHSGLDQGIKEFLQGFEILATVGRGGMGTVYRAKRQSDGAIVALKTLLPSFAREKDAVDRFMRESEVLQKLHHPHIVAAQEAGFQNDVYYLVMEFVEGDTLAKVIKARGKLPWKETIKIVKAVAFALEHASRYGVVHRDIKPDNLILTPSGGVKIMDLGLAKMIGGERETTLTQSGFVLGTPAFMSPEQVQGQKDIDVRSDIYSLGITLYCALTGVPPFRDENPLVVLQMRLKEDVPFGKLREMGVPEEVISIGRKMTMRDPRHRYQSPTELLEDLMSLEAGETKRRMLPAASMQGGLFGRIAVLNRFITTEQLDRVIAIQEELLVRGVKRPIGEIMLDEGLINRRQLRKILSLQSFYDRRNEERKLADLAIKNGFATDAQVKEALARQKDIFLLEGHAPTLDGILRSKGVISEQQRKALLRTRRRLEEKETGVRDTLIGVKECSRCLEVIPLHATQCPRCEHIMDQGAVEVKCRGCGRLQTEPGEFCLFCGANPVTGKQPQASKLKTCPQCGKYAAFYQLRCAACKARLPGSVFRTSLRGLQETVKYMWKHGRAAAMLLVILTVGYIIIMRTTSAGRFWSEIFEGEPAVVRHQAQEFLDALLHRDYVGAAKYTGRDARTAEEAQAAAFRAFQRVFPDSKGYSIRSYTIEKVSVESGRASVYLMLEYVPEGLSAGGSDSRRVTLYLVQKSGVWTLP